MPLYLVRDLRVGPLVVGVLVATDRLGSLLGAAATHRQLASPPELLSRVMAAVRFVSWGAIPVGSLLAGLTAKAMGTRVALAVFCLLASFAPLVIWVGPIRRLRDLEDPVVVDPPSPR